jgi:hypothetical protein
MSHLCGNGGGSLGGQRGDDCRVDLGLKDCGGFRHPKNKRKCGLELEWAKNQRTIYLVGEAADLWLE